MHGNRYKKIYSSFKRGEVVYVDFGAQSHGVQGGIRPCIVVSSNAGNHCRAPQITVCPLTTKIKDKPVHVKIESHDVTGYQLKQTSEMLAEDIMTVSKDAVRGKVGFIKEDTDIMKQINHAVMLHLGITEYKESKEVKSYNETR